MKVVGVIVLSLFVISTSVAGESGMCLTGNPRVDLFSSRMILAPLEHGWNQDTVMQMTLNPPDRKSSWAASGLSLVVPGAGELYAESYWKSGLFFAAEVAAWIVAYAYDKKGDRQTDIFQDYADAHWSIVTYANWIRQYYSAEASVITANPGDPQYWDQVNMAEDAIAQRPSPTGFTHHLPHRPEQQYYELIGKYPQFLGGWDDAGNRGPTDVLNANVSPRFLDYSLMRGKANDYYNIASVAVSVVVVNHVLSAIDAYFTASAFNRSLHAEARMNMRQTAYGAIAEPVASLRMEL